MEREKNKELEIWEKWGEYENERMSEWKSKWINAWMSDPVRKRISECVCVKEKGKKDRARWMDINLLKKTRFF